MAKSKQLLKLRLKDAEAAATRIAQEALFWREMYEAERRLTMRLTDGKYPKDTYKQGPIAAILDRMIERENGRERTEAATDPQPASPGGPGIQDRGPLPGGDAGLPDGADRDAGVPDRGEDR